MLRICIIVCFFLSVKVCKAKSPMQHVLVVYMIRTNLISLVKWPWWIQNFICKFNLGPETRITTWWLKRDGASWKWHKIHSHLKAIRMLERFEGRRWNSVCCSGSAFTRSNVKAQHCFCLWLWISSTIFLFSRMKCANIQTNVQHNSS